MPWIMPLNGLGFTLTQLEGVLDGPNRTEACY